MGSVVVPYSAVQQAFKDNPDAVHNAVYESAANAAGGNPMQQARLIADWHSAVAALEQSSQEPLVLSTPQNGLASRLQTMLAARASTEGKTQVAQPRLTVTTAAGDSDAEETVIVKFDNGDLVGWLGTGLRILFHDDPHPWIAPPENRCARCTSAVCRTCWIRSRRARGSSTFRVRAFTVRAAASG